MYKFEWVRMNNGRDQYGWCVVCVRVFLGELRMWCAAMKGGRGAVEKDRFIYGNVTIILVKLYVVGESRRQGNRQRDKETRVTR